MSADGASGNLKIPRNGDFGAVVEDAAHDLEFASRELQAFGDFFPGAFREHGRTAEMRNDGV